MGCCFEQSHPKPHIHMLIRGKGVILLIGGPSLIIISYSIGNPIVWRSKNQSLAWRTSEDVEFHVVANVVCEIIWVKSLLKEIGLQLSLAPVVCSENTNIVAVSENPIHHSKMKYVESDLFFVREKVQSWEIIVNFVPATEQTVNILTKYLSKETVVPCRKKLGVFSIE